MTITTAKTHGHGIYTFYVSSASVPGRTHSVKYVRHAGQRRLFCSCADFLHRRVAAKRLCKHARAVAGLIRAFRGVSRLAVAIAGCVLRVDAAALQNL
jgi:hypothetical protein